MKIRCAVVDDDPKDLQNITKAITRLSGETSHSVEVFSYLRASEVPDRLFDLYVLDIDLPGETGFQLANHLYERFGNVPVIFCTNHDDLVFDSFKLNAFYFVRKSFLKEDLSLALQKYMQIYFSENSHYTVKTIDRVSSIPHSDILYFEVYRNTLYTYTKERKYQERKTMKQLLEELPDNQYIQISQSYVVNASQIKEISGNILRLSNGHQIDIPRRNMRRVKEEYILFLSR